MAETFDSIIIGGGAAGLAAATILARSRRNILVIDAKKQSNKITSEAHGVFTRDGIFPEKLYEIAKKQLLKYPTVKILNDKITTVHKKNGEFIVKSKTRKNWQARSILLAQGMKYQLPNIPGIEELYGTKIWHCPYCDGYEFSDKKIIVLGDIKWLRHMRILLPQWSRNILVSPLKKPLNKNFQKQLQNAGGKIIGKIIKIEDEKKGLNVMLEDGKKIHADGMIVDINFEQRDELNENLQCKCDKKGHIITDKMGKTNVPGIYCAGDQMEFAGQVNLAVATGHRAALAINLYLAKLDRTKEKK